MPASAAAQLRSLAAHAKAVGDRGIINAVRATARAETKPLVNAMRGQALARLPKANGLNVQVAGQKWTTRTLTGTRTAGITLTTTAPDTQQSNDLGFVRHPLPGNRRGKGQWYVTETPAALGWATDTAGRYVPTITAHLTDALAVAVDSVTAI